MAWAGSGLVWSLAGGVLGSQSLADAAGRGRHGFSFVQVSDSHIGFKVDGINNDVTGTLQAVIDRINGLPQRPDLVIHTGDLTHLSAPAQFDTVQQMMGTIRTGGVFYVPGEHDVIGDRGAAYRARFAPRASDRLYYSMDHGGVHFVALSNIGVEDQFGVLGSAQIEWLRRDLAGVHSDTPIVVFAHVPLYAVYPQWGWFTKDSAQTLDLLKGFSSVTVLNGHIHQVMSQVEGRIHFHVADSTAFPQHRPGDGKPGPFKLPSDELLHSLGYRTATVVPGRHTLTVVDSTLA